jgi:hypothetical protein
LIESSKAATISSLICKDRAGKARDRFDRIIGTWYYVSFH